MATSDDPPSSATRCDSARALRRLDDTDRIRRLIFAYGYYLDRWLYDDVVACFAEDAEFHMLNGIFRGRDAGIRRLFDTLRQNWQAEHPPVPGGLSEHLILQDMIDIAEDGEHATGRFRLLEMIGAHESNQRLRLGPPGGPYDPDGPRQWLGGSLYLSRFVRRGGVWQIAEQAYHPVWSAAYEEGWAKARPPTPTFTALYPDDPCGPDAFRDAPVAWPGTSILPPHFPHPVTGAAFEQPATRGMAAPRSGN